MSVSRANKAHELIGELMADYSADELLSKDGLIKQLTKVVLERALEAELTEHLGYEKGERVSSTA